MDEATGQHLWTLTQRTAAAIRESGVCCEGINLFLAGGEVPFRRSYMYNMGVFPRYEGDPFKLVADWDVKPSREELDLVAAQIRLAYDRLWKNNN